MFRISFLLNPLFEGLNERLVKFSLFSEDPEGKIRVRRESPRLEFEKEPDAGVTSLRLEDDCSTLASKAGSLLK